MFRTIANKMLMVIYFVLGALIMEALTFYVLELGVMPEYFWYNLSIILVIAFIVFIIPNYVAQYVIYTIILTVQMVLIYVNYSLSQVYGDLFSIDMIRLVGEAGAAMTSSFVYISVLFQLLLLFAVIVTVGARFLKYCKKDKNDIKQHFSIFSIIIIITAQFFGLGFSFKTREEVNAMFNIADQEYLLSDKFLMNTSILKTGSYAKFGTYGYFTNLIANAIRNDGASISSVTIDYFNSGKIYGTEGNSSEVFGIDNGNNVIVFMMESVEWFAFGDGKYDKTFSNLSYELVPNIYGLIYGEDYLTDTNNENLDNDALISKNFFAKSKTNMSEGQGIIGNYPIAQSLSDVVENDTESSRALGYSIPNVLRNIGYNTTYVHSHDIEYYSRNETHYYLGFDTVVGKNDIKDEYGNYMYTGDELDFHKWEAEGTFARNAINYIVPEDRTKPFYTFYLNVSSHGPFTAHKNEHDGDALKYYNYVKYGEDDCVLDANGHWILSNTTNPTYTNWYSNVLEYHPAQAEELVYYLAGVKGLDEAIGVVIDKLKEYDILDETTLLLYSDHNAYYGDLSHNVKKLDTENNNSKELNTIPLIISSPGIKDMNKTKATDEKFLLNTRFSSSYDVVPTLLDLLGVPFNENFYLGHSLFRPSDLVYTEDGVTKDMVVYYSNTGGLFSDSVYSFDLKTFVTIKDCSQETVDIFKAECRTILEKINFLSFLNRYNLYKKVTNI